MTSSIYMAKAQLIVEIGNMEAALDTARRWELEEGPGHHRAIRVLLRTVKLQVTKVLRRTAPEAMERARLRNIHTLVDSRLGRFLSEADREVLAGQVNHVLETEARRVAILEAAADVPTIRPEGPSRGFAIPLPSDAEVA